MGQTVIFELGCEDLPALQIDMASRALVEAFSTRASAARLDFGSIQAFATPRRLAIWVKELAEKQCDLSLRKLGPPMSAARKEDGSLTAAALGFLAGLGLGPEAIQEVMVEKKGKPVPYLAVDYCEQGRLSVELLPNLLEQCLDDIHWAKPMRWGSETKLFARPVHWILARLDEQILDLQFAGVHSGGHSYGHRFMAPAAIEVRHGDQYLEALRKAYVLASVEERRQVVEAEIARVAESVGGHILPNPALLDEVVQILEWPVGIVGSFDAEFLALPREVLETTMCKNQRYFSVLSECSELMPYFVTLSNTAVEEPSVVARGNARVLRARLKDAEFFYAEDGKHTLGEYLERLRRVRYIEGMGSIYDKVERIEALSLKLAEAWQGAVDLDELRLVARLAKADLATGMVGEFPELQGVIGKYYALREGYPEALALAIEEHYAPRQAGEAVATTVSGAIVGLADKLDAIVALFALGRIPSGAADPFALRRAALGLMHTLLEWKQPLALQGLVESAMERVLVDMQGFGSQAQLQGPALCQAVLEFIATRMRFYWVEWFSTKEVEAAFSGRPLANLPALLARLTALVEHRNSPSFKRVACTFKRVANILKGAKAEVGGVAPERFVEEAEVKLYCAVAEAEELVKALVARQDFTALVGVLEGLGEPCDAFFEQVMVNVEDAALRENRLALLAKLQALFDELCDVSKL